MTPPTLILHIFLCLATLIYLRVYYGMSKKKKVYDVFNAITGEVEGTIAATEDELEQLKDNPEEVAKRMDYTKAEMEVVKNILVSKLELKGLLKKPESMD